MSQQSPGIDLNQLPQLKAPEDRLAAVLAGAPTTSKIRSRRWAALSAVACTLLIAGLASLLPNRATAPEEGQVADSRPDAFSVGLDAWIDYSQQLEQQLRQVSAVAGVVRGHRAAAINVLTEELMLIDLALARSTQENFKDDEILALWQVRTARLNDLLAVHTAGRNSAAMDQAFDPAKAPVVTLQAPLAAATLSQLL